MNYSVDRIENDIIILQNLDTKEMKEINKKSLRYNVKEGDILVYKDNIYIKDDNLKQDRLKMLEEKLKRVQNINNN